MVDLGRYSLKVSPYHLYRRATLRKMMILMRKKGVSLTIKNANKMIDNSSFTEEMKDSYAIGMYMRETTDTDWAIFVFEDNSISIQNL